MDIDIVNDLDINNKKNTYNKYMNNNKGKITKYNKE